MPYNNKRKKESEQRRKDLYAQKKASRQFIYDNEFRDLINGEKVNQVDQTDIRKKLDTLFDGIHINAAVPLVERAEVLDIPNLYHVELFPDCNELNRGEM